MSASAAVENRPSLGLIGFFIGIAALIVVTLHISGTFVEADKSAATTIGEIAAEIKDSAQRAISGDPPPAAEEPASSWDVTRVLVLAIPILAGLAAILGAIGLYRKEAPTLPAIAIALGCAAFTMQYLLWLALIIGGICILVAIINNLDSIFSI